MAVVATVSALCEPWVSPQLDKPTLPANSAVGVATKACIFIAPIMSLRGASLLIARPKGVVQNPLVFNSGI